MPFDTDRERGAHLLRRFGLGASEAELDYYMKDGLSGAVDKLLNPPDDPGSVVDINLLRNEKGVPIQHIVNAWILRLVSTRRPLEERMTLFWHNHFATGAVKVEAGQMMHQQNRTLRENALKPFPQMLEAISKDPAMLVWLDNQENVAGKPNENFAREVMELFTLGEGNVYTEKDVQEAARAFTGWQFRRGGRGGGPATFLYRPTLHDDGPKTLLGRTGPLGGDDVLKILCEQPETATFLVRKFWEWFVWPQPEAATIAPFATRFYKSGLDMRALARDVMLSKEFYSDRARRALVKNPVDVVVVTMRQLGIGEGLRELLGGQSVRRAVAPAFVARQAMTSMGMQLMDPPDVSGWKTGDAWITSATMAMRIGWADRLFGAEKTDLKAPAFPLFADDPTPEGVVAKLLSLFDLNVSPERRKVIVKAATDASGGRVTSENSSTVAAKVSRLLFATPEFQFC